MSDAEDPSPPNVEPDEAETDPGPQGSRNPTEKPAFHFLPADDGEAVRLLREIHGLPPHPVEAPKREAE